MAYKFDQSICPRAAKSHRLIKKIAKVVRYRTAGSASAIFSYRV